MSEVDLIMTKRNVEIINPKLPNIRKIGKAARLCYRVENDTNTEEVDRRIIGNCIADGHESILEHGVYSLFINTENTSDSIDASKYTNNGKPLNFLIAWNFVETDAQRKYTEMFHDTDIHAKHCERYGLEKIDKVLPVTIGNARAWRQVIREKLFLATNTGDPLQFVLATKVLFEFSKTNGGDVIFGDIVNTFNNLLAVEERRKYLLFGEEVFKELETFNVETVSNFYFKDHSTIYVEEACAAASLSVIITTDRASTHQLVRHRKNVAYSQESQRYVNYDKKGFRVIPITVDPNRVKDHSVFSDPIGGYISENTSIYKTWLEAMNSAFGYYHALINDETCKIPPESCRGVLPNDTATKIGVTWMGRSGFANLCYWRLESHAQYAIRNVIANVVADACISKHLYMTSMDQNIVIKWIDQIVENKLVNEDKQAKLTEDKAERTKIIKAVQDMIRKEQLRRAAMSAAEAEKPNEATETKE